MNTSSTRFHRLLAVTAVSLGLTMSMAPPVRAAAEGTGQMEQEWSRRRLERLKTRLAKWAERLEIKASQQGAWQAYANAYGAMIDRHVKRPNDDADAAALGHYRAEVAANRARMLAQLADATAKLQAVLTPDQRKTLDDIARNSRHRGHGWRHERGLRDDNPRRQ